MIAAQRWRRFMERNRGQRTKALLRRSLRAGYRHEIVRTAARRLFAKREPAQWVFLVGCYNSGTSLTQQIVAAHPEIRAMPTEGVHFTSVLPQPDDLGWMRMWIGCPEHMTMPPGRQPRLVDRMVRDWSPWWAPGGTAFLEKSITNVTRMAWLEENFANVYFVGITRNGYCAAEGIRRRARPRGRAARQVGRVYPIEMAARQWVVANEAMLAGAERVGRYLQISYEQLVAQPGPVVQRIWRYLDLDDLGVALAGDYLVVAGRRFEIQNMNPSSLARLTPEEIAAMTPIIADMQTRLGYEVMP